MRLGGGGFFLPTYRTRFLEMPGTSRWARKSAWCQLGLALRRRWGTCTVYTSATAVVGAPLSVVPVKINSIQFNSIQFK